MTFTVDQPIQARTLKQATVEVLDLESKEKLKWKCRRCISEKCSGYLLILTP